MIKRVINYFKNILFYNTKRVEGLEAFVLSQQEHLSNLQKEKSNLEAFVLSQQEHLSNLQKEKDYLEETLFYKLESKIKLEISKKITLQSLLFHQRIEQFIKELEKKIETKQDISLLKQALPSIILDDYYLAFENNFRGSRDDIIKRYESYLQYINSSSINSALDIGCGRGEWVEILQSKNIDAIGIDLNFAMINEGLNKGVKNLYKIDAFEFFKSSKDNSFDLVTAFHVIEHIPYQQLFKMFQELKRVAKPNATILLETPNPQNLLVAAYEFYKDPTHLNPLPSDVIKFMLEYIGFKDIEIKLLHPFPKEFNIKEDSEVAKRLNNYLYSSRDYLIIAKNYEK